MPEDTVEDGPLLDDRDEPQAPAASRTRRDVETKRCRRFGPYESASAVSAGTSAGISLDAVFQTMSVSTSK